VAARGRDRWVINKLRALCTWYTKGLDGGSQFRVAVNSAVSLQELRDSIASFFFERAAAGIGTTHDAPVPSEAEPRWS
jgi:hypothetical protein